MVNQDYPMKYKISTDFENGIRSFIDQLESFIDHLEQSLTRMV